MKTIEIIPIDYENVEFLKNLKFKDVYVTSLEHISKMLAYEKYPIKNKNIAIKSILDLIDYYYIEKQKKEKRNEPLAIHRDVFINFFNRNSYKRFIEILSELNILKRVQYPNGSWYEPEVGSCLYVLDRSFEYAELCFTFFDKKESKSVQMKSTIKVDKRFFDTVKNAEIDTIKAIQAEIKEYKDDKRKLKSRISRVLSFYRNDRYIKKGPNVDRIYHSLSGISKISRPFVTIHGQSFNSIDIRNCQPLLLCAFLEKSGFEYDDEYKNDCENGDFYEKFYTNPNDRDKTKVLLYKTIFFDWKSNFKINKKFKELYPKTWESVNTFIETNSNTTLASRLQNLEAYIMNSITPLSSRYYYTLFDEINYSNITDKSYLEDKIIKKFVEFGLVPSFK